MLEKINNKYHVILGSKSPRRHKLISELGLTFEIITADIDETPLKNQNGKETAEYLAKKKAEAISIGPVPENFLIIAADTVVWYKNKPLGKPGNFREAYDMIFSLSGDCHEVITGVCLKSISKTISFCEVTRVWFREISTQDIEYYINQYKPFDKAGAYGIQEWIGLAGIKKIDGCYFNVVGLPASRVYKELLRFEG